MSTYIQVNIYNQTLETLKLRGIDLAVILKTLSCGDCWISEVPIHPPKKSTAPRTPVKPVEEQRTPMKPFKSISAEICSIQPLTLDKVLGEIGDKPGSGSLQGLFDDWDPLLNLGSTSTAAAPEDSPEDPMSTESPLKLTSAPSEFTTPKSSTRIPPENRSESLKLLGEKWKIPKEEPVEEEEEEDMKMELNDSEAANRHEMQIIQDLLNQKSSVLPTNIASAGEGSLKSVQIKMESLVKSRRKLISEDPEISTTIYTIICSFPGCSHQYNWRVKYGKLRLLDHALTHSDTRIPCKLCGFEATNVRRMRSHYAKHHPNERVQGYGMKALVSEEQDNEEELKELWNKCYCNYIGLIGEAGLSDGDKFRRNTKKRKAAEMVEQSEKKGEEEDA